MKWQHYCKDLLMVVFSISFLLTAPAVYFFLLGSTIKGIYIISFALVSGTLSFLIADYWHKHDIHATLFGNILSLVTFVGGIFLLWKYGFYFWLPILLFASFVTFGYIIGKNK